MSSWPRRLWRALTRSIAVTDRQAGDPRLRGRTYAIPFEQVWQIALALAGGDLKRWVLVHADDEPGTIRARVKPLLFGSASDVTISIGLDGNAQTRVDLRARSRTGPADFGANARRIARFCRGLDGRLEQARRARRTDTPRTGSGVMRPSSARRSNRRPAESTSTHQPAGTPSAQPSAADSRPSHPRVGTQPGRSPDERGPAQPPTPQRTGG